MRAHSHSTDMNQGLRDDPERKKFYESKVMLGRISDVEEQAGLAVFLLSPYASCKCLQSSFQCKVSLHGRYHRVRLYRRWRGDSLVMGLLSPSNLS